MDSFIFTLRAFKTKWHPILTPDSSYSEAWIKSVTWMRKKKLKDGISGQMMWCWGECSYLFFALHVERSLCNPSRLHFHSHYPSVEYVKVLANATRSSSLELDHHLELVARLVEGLRRGTRTHIEDCFHLQWLHSVILNCLGSDPEPFAPYKLCDLCKLLSINNLQASSREVMWFTQGHTENAKTRPGIQGSWPKIAKAAHGARFNLQMGLVWTVQGFENYLTGRPQFKGTGRFHQKLWTYCSCFLVNEIEVIITSASEGWHENCKWSQQLCI